MQLQSQFRQRGTQVTVHTKRYWLLADTVHTKRERHWLLVLQSQFTQRYWSQSQFTALDIGYLTVTVTQRGVGYTYSYSQSQFIQRDGYLH